MPATHERQDVNGKAQLAAEHHNPPPKARLTRSSDNGGYWAALALVLGLLVPVLGFVAILDGLLGSRRAEGRQQGGEGGV
jgi:hypothetical protein